MKNAWPRAYGLLVQSRGTAVKKRERYAQNWQTRNKAFRPLNAGNSGGISLPVAVHHWGAIYPFQIYSRKAAPCTRLSLLHATQFRHYGPPHRRRQNNLPSERILFYYCKSTTSAKLHRRRCKRWTGWKQEQERRLYNYLRCFLRQQLSWQRQELPDADATSDTKYRMNIIDTPGHVDFTH